MLDAAGLPPANLDHNEVTTEIEKHAKILDAHRCHDRIKNVVVVHCGTTSSDPARRQSPNELTQSDVMT